MSSSWYTITGVDEIPSPALLIYPQRVRDNICRMINYAGGTQRLRPHVKTHKMAEVTRLKMAAGIDKFKCSTIAEAEMVAACGAADVMLAFPPLGPNIQRLIRLVTSFPATRFSTLTDDAKHVAVLSQECCRAGVIVDVLLDVDSGMHRSGIAPSAAAIALYALLAKMSGLRPGGLHVYDGHLRNPGRDARRAEVLKSFGAVDTLRKQLREQGWAVPRVVAGGTFSFPIYAERDDVECSPGTPVLWDQSYTTKIPDLEFLPAALLLTRVVSQPATRRLCLDLGYKAVSADNADPRVVFPGLPDARMVIHSEEHLVIETDLASQFAVGDVLYGIPWHVCPTVALHREAYVIEEGRCLGTWQVVARERRLTI